MTLTSSFYQIRGGSWLFLYYIPDRRAQTLQPPCVILLAGNRWLPSLFLLFQTDALTNTSSVTFSPGSASEQILLLLLFHNALFAVQFAVLYSFSLCFQPFFTWLLQSILRKINLFPFAFSSITLIPVWTVLTGIFIGITDISIFLDTLLS